MVPPAPGEFLLYQSEDGRSRLDIRFDGETLWLTQAQMAELFQTTSQNITLHLKAVFAEGEIDPAATCKEYLQVRSEGARTVTRALQHYALPAILAVGMRVRSARGTQFRPRWVFQAVQNKLHFAVTKLTAPEIIARRVDADAPNMGLTAFDGAQVRRRDVTVAKNYLLEPEITELNRIVGTFLDFAEDQASRRRQIFLRDLEQRLDDFLRFNDRAVLTDGGSVSRADANQRAVAAYDAFDARRRAELEAAAERDSMAELERAAKALPKRAKKRDARGGES